MGWGGWLEEEEKGEGREGKDTNRGRKSELKRVYIVAVWVVSAWAACSLGEGNERGKG